MKSKKSNFILIVHGEPNSIFLEIFFKALKKKIFKKPIILISSERILKLQMKYLNFKKNIRFLDFRKKYGLTDDSIIITFLGRLHQGKGNDFLLKGISRVSKKRKNLCCMLVGADDGHEATLRNLSKELNFIALSITSSLKLLLNNFAKKLAIFVNSV